MKKYLLLLSVCLVLAVASDAQRTVVYQPYASVGSVLNSGKLSHGAEVGIYSNKMWHSLGASAQRVNDKTNWMVTAKTYYKVIHDGPVDFYASGAVSVDVNKAKQITLEPGVATVFNLGDHWAPQFSLSLPVRNTTGTVSYGVGINYWFN